MSMGDPPQPGPPGMAPPSVPGALQTEKKPSAWPMVVGVIAIIFGAMGALGGCFGAISPLFFRVIAAAVPEDQPTGLEFMADWTAWIVLVSGLGLVIALLLLVGGIGVVGRHAWGPKTCLVWAGVKMIFVVFNSVVGYFVQQAQFEAMQEMMAQDPNTPANMPGMMGAIMPALAALGAVIGFIWGWALPLFMLIWFSRGRIRTEVAEWGARG